MQDSLEGPYLVKPPSWSSAWKTFPRSPPSPLNSYYTNDLLPCNTDYLKSLHQGVAKTKQIIKCDG